MFEQLISLFCQFHIKYIMCLNGNRDKSNHSTYKVLTFDQFPMKSGILPVSSVSDAHLQQSESIGEDDK